MAPALTARKLGMTPRMRFGCGGGVFCAAGFALSDCCPAACVPLGCAPWRSASAALPPAAVVDNAAPESCESASAPAEASCANENRAPPQIITPVRNSAPIRRKAEPPYPKQTYPESDASSGHEVARTPRKASRADSTPRPVSGLGGFSRFSPNSIGSPYFKRVLRESVRPHTRASAATIGCTKGTGSPSTDGGRLDKLLPCRRCSTHRCRCKTICLPCGATSRRAGSGCASRRSRGSCQEQVRGRARCCQASSIYYGTRECTN